MTAKGTSADKPSDPGSTGLKWAAAEQHWVPLFNTSPEVPALNLSRAPCNSCARLRQRLCCKHCRERDVVRCFESLNWLAGRRDCCSEHDESDQVPLSPSPSSPCKSRTREFGNLLMNEANELPRSLFSKLPFESCWDIVLSVDSTGTSWCVGCPRLYDVVPVSSRQNLENMQSMIESKVGLENTDPPPAAYRDPVLKRNRSKRLQIFARLLEIGLLRPRLKGAAKHFLGHFFVNKKRKKQKRLILGARIVNWSFVSPHGVNLCSSEADSWSTAFSQTFALELCL